MKQTVINYPPSNDDIDNRLRRISHKIDDALQHAQQHRYTTNISRDEEQTLQNLKQKPLIYLPSDKGGEFCVIEENRYKEAGLTHLNDPEFYRKIAHITPKAIELRINNVWKTICQIKNIPDRIRKSFITKNSRVPRFYHLIKTHKPLVNLKVRPIVSNCNGPTEKLSWLLTKILTPLLDNVPAHLKNSNTLIERLQTLTPSVRQQYPYPFSLDVVALYTSIPVEDAITNTINILERDHFHHSSLSNSDINDLLKVLLSNTYFQFYDNTFLQIKGLAMGSNISPILAILFMDTLERQALTSSTYISFYARYVDDIFCLTHDQQSAENFKTMMDLQHPSIRFEIEHPQEGHILPLLDVKVTMNNERSPTFEHYKKSARKDVFVHYRSALAISTKINIIRNERKRINERCSTNYTKNIHNKKFDELLLKMDILKILSTKHICQ